MGLIWVRDSSRTPEYYALFPDVMGPYYSSWASSDYLANAHAESAITCQSCHPRTFGESLGEMVAYARGEYEVPLQEHPDEECFQCHGSYAEVIQGTEALELNPHESHLGELDCEICHKMHGPSVDYCAQCHGAVATGPGWTTEVTPTAEVEVWAPDMDCSACHVMDPFFESLQDTNLLAYAPAQEGLECLDCHELAVLEQVHEEAVPGAPVAQLRVDMQFCFDCHVPNEHTSYEQVIELTADYIIDDQNINPHDPHAGLEQPQVECRYCHKMHKESPLIKGCYSCHHAGTFESCSTCH